MDHWPKDPADCQVHSCNIFLAFLPCVFFLQMRMQMAQDGRLSGICSIHSHWCLTDSSRSITHVYPSPVLLFSILKFISTCYSFHICSTIRLYGPICVWGCFSFLACFLLLGNDSIILTIICYIFTHEDSLI